MLKLHILESNEIVVDERFKPEEPKVDPCKAYTDECNTMRCPYGQMKSLENSGCVRCTCSDPCEETLCENNFKCVIGAYRDSDTGETKFRAECRIGMNIIYFVI